VCFKHRDDCPELTVIHQNQLAIMNKHPHVYKTAAGSGVLHFVCLAILLCSFAVTAQAGWKEPHFTSPFNMPPITVSGKVVDSKNAALEGVSVLVKGTKKGVTTNAAGVYSIANVPDNAILIFSYTGFESREMAVKGQASLNVSLTEHVSGLNDVVVVGYGTATKKDLTGAVSQIKATVLENDNPRAVGDILRGNAPGVDVGFDGSTKGSTPKIEIRGRGSLTASTSPLIVLDGVIYGGGLEDINPNDIATLDILKDASAAAVFGARSANGVILITTKKGKVGKPQITFNDNMGLNKVERKPHLLNGPEFLEFRGQAVWAMAGFDSTSKPGVQYKFQNPATLPSSLSVAQWQALDNSTGDPVVTWLTRLKLKAIEITNYQAGKVLDWDKLIYNQNALQYDHTISISQRREDYNYYFSVGYLENQGITVGDRFKTLRSRLNLEATVSKFLTVGVNFQFAERDESSVGVNLSDMLQTTPYGSLFQDDGVTLRVSPNDDPGNNTNPFMSQYYTDRMYKYDNFFAQFSVKGKLPYGFSYSVNFSPRFDLVREYNHQSALNPVIAGQKGIIDRTNQTQFQWNLDNILRWNGKFGKHTIEATFLVNAEKFQQYRQTSHGENLQPNDNLGFNSIQSATAAVRTSTDDQYETGDALMGRVAYNYNQRYFLTATIRRDGYSAFGQQNPRANFPSLGFAWALSEERFMKNTNKWLDYLKLRASYGENGNRSIGRYAALSNLGSSTYVFIPSGGGTPYNVAQVYSNNLSNPELKWERNKSIDIGLDYSILRGVVTGAIEYYTRNTKDLLVNRALPSITGFGSILANLGEVQNKGFEISVNTQNMKHANFEWRSTIAFWANTNKIVHLYGPTPDFDATGKQIGTSEKDDLANGWFIGHAITEKYDYKQVGVWQLSEAATAKSYGFKPGDMKLQDTNGDGVYTLADKVFVGDYAPKFSWSLRNEFRVYKNFDFSFTLNSKIGQVYNFNEAKNVDRFYDRANFYQRPFWTPSNPINDYAAINSNVGNFTYYKSASFVRLSSISLAYTLPAEISHRWKFESIKAYFNVTNAFVISGWNYFDPEYKGPDPNNPTNLAPVPLTLNFGLNVTL
jgi:TonB-linked SusC/RagA family outer membrane protein